MNPKRPTLLIGELLKSTNWKDIAELIGIAAIVASLLFVGMQMKQSQDIAIASTGQTRTAIAVDFITTMTSDPVIRSALTKQRQGDSASMSPEERVAMANMAYANLLFMEDIYHQYLGGFITEDKWHGTRANLKAGLSHWRGGPYLRPMYDSTPAEMWSPSFSALLEEIVTEIDSENPQ
jgi:hypothetical protein